MRYQMRKLFIALFIIFLSSSAFAGDAYDQVMKTGKIKCGYGIWDPFINYDFEKEAPKGLLVDLMENIASKINLELEWPEETGWANMPTALNNGRIDVACSSLWNDPIRGRSIAFTDPIFYMAVHAYVREDSSFDFKTIEDMNKANIRISVQEGDFSFSVAERLFPNAQKIALSPINSSTELLVQVALGKADVVTFDQAGVTAFNQKNEQKLKRVNLAVPVTVFGNSYAVSIHESALKEVLNTAVRNLIQTGEIEDLTAEFRKEYPDQIILPAKPYQALR